MTTPESFGVKKHFRASSRPYGAVTCLPRHATGPGSRPGALVSEGVVARRYSATVRAGRIGCAEWGLSGGAACVDGVGAGHSGRRRVGQKDLN